MLTLWLLLACSTAPAALPDPSAAAAPEPALVVEPPPPVPVWPAPGAPLRLLEAPPPKERALRLVIDAGHGAPGNLGNTSVRCEAEADFTRRTQDAVVARLAGSAGLEVKAGRPTEALRSYDARIATFNAWPADAVISLHSDTRAGDGWSRSPTTGCWEGHGATGFAVLYSDSGKSSLVEARLRLARAVALRMVEAGLPAYGGGDYPGLYDPDPQVPGVFVDRHAPGKTIRMLRATQVPLVIVETHQAVDPDEAARWDEPATLHAFASAIRAATLDAGPAGRI